ncbi:matE family protein [Mycobacterium xenopi 4042]|uniref:MatE family protein n=1 Tax=Mycobacterium xenopi 4042 TaxID=1299334 RepID=X8CH13_MYCXE|nr:matE family protein [Mycobacterium xenopi 4042]
MMGRDLVVRTLAFQACFVSAAAVAARFGAAALGRIRSCCSCGNFLRWFSIRWPSRRRHWSGRARASQVSHAKSVARRVTMFSAITAVALAAPLALGASALPRLFTDDPAVLAVIGVPWWFLVAQLPVAGTVFGLDGVLLGAGDARFMRTATVVSALAGFLPLIWLSLVFGWGWQESGRG